MQAAVMLDPAATLLQNKFKDFKHPGRHAHRRRTRSTCSAASIRAARSTPAPTGSQKNEATVQKLTNAIIATLKWIHSHTPEEIMAKMPAELVGPDKALYLAALKNTIPMYLEDRHDGPEGRAGGARGVQPVGAGDRQGEHRPVEDLHQPLRRGRPTRA